ncbi:MAG: peptide deformylase [Actinomycetota bacterium]
MAVLSIRTFGDPVLRQRAREVERITDVHRRVIADMFETMRDAPGVGLAAPQLGVLERIFVWEVEERHGAVVNPVIVERSKEEVEEEEGCLSLPGLLFPVRRSERVVIEGLDENGRAVREEGSELLARVFQHEIDHLDGVLFIDRLPEALRKEATSKLADQALGFPATPEVQPEAAL